MAANEAVGSSEPFIPPDSFALRLMALRHALKLTQQQAAARCGLDDGSWSNWENGVTPRGMDIVVGKIVAGLGADRDWLMWGGGVRGQNLKKMNLAGLRLMPSERIEPGPGQLVIPFRPRLSLVPT